MGLTALGLALLAITLPAGDGAHSTYSLAGMIAFESALLAVGTLLVLSPRLGAPHTTTGYCSGRPRASSSECPT